MNSIFGILIGLGIAFLFGIGRASEDLAALEARKPLQDEDVSQDDCVTEQKEDKITQYVYPNPQPIKIFKRAFIIMAGLFICVIGIGIYIDGPNDMELTLVIAVCVLGLFSPFIFTLGYNAYNIKEALVAKQPYLEFHKRGMVCHSVVCGPKQEILWVNITGFTPILPVLMLSRDIIIEHIAEDTGKALVSRYQVNMVGIELAHFIALLEYYTGLPSKDPT